MNSPTSPTLASFGIADPGPGTVGISAGIGTVGISRDVGGGYAFSGADGRDAPWDEPALDLYPRPSTRHARVAVDDHTQAVRAKVVNPGLRIVDLRDLCSPIRDQGCLDSCTGFAVAALGEFLLNRQGRPMVQLSPRFLWYVGHQFEDITGQNVGLRPRNALLAMLRVGCTPEQFDPYPPVAYHPVVTKIPPPRPLDEDPGKLRAWLKLAYGPMNGPDFQSAAARPPTPDAVVAAANYRISFFHSLWQDHETQAALDVLNEADNTSDAEHKRRLEQQVAETLRKISQDETKYGFLQDVVTRMKQCLDRWYTIVLAGNVYTSFIESRTGITPAVSGVFEAPDEHQLSYPVSQHCMLVVGYVEPDNDYDRNEHGYFICRNSLGRNWGERGYFYLPYKYVLTPGCVLEAWTAA
jgi:hypothetical protein